VHAKVRAGGRAAGRRARMWYIGERGEYVLLMAIKRQAKRRTKTATPLEWQRIFDQKCRHAAVLCEVEVE